MPPLFPYSYPCHTSDHPCIPTDLGDIAVHPSYQRQGLGSLLLRDGLAVVDGDHACILLSASPKGVELYKRFGWVQIDEYWVDMLPHGGTGWETKKTMKREPRASMG